MCSVVTYLLPGHSLTSEREKILHFHVLILLSLDACGRPPTYFNMRVKGAIKNKYYIGERIYFECVPGYYHFTIHVMSGVCKPDNTWTTPMVEACLSNSTKPFLVFLLLLSLAMFTYLRIHFSGMTMKIFSCKTRF